MKKTLKVLALVLALSIALVGCGGGTAKEESKEQAPAATAGEKKEAATTGEAVKGEITVVSREEGSGTRDAFVEITGVMKDKVDGTTLEATIQNSTNNVMTTVSQDPNAIGYISLGSLNDTVKALKVDGVEATEAKIKAGEYKISRPFNIAYQEAKLSPAGQAFIDFIFSEEGQKIVVDQKYIAVKDKPEPHATVADLSGTVVVGGSTSVTPIMEKMAEAFMASHAGVKIEIQSTGSGAGMTGVMDGTLEIGMASRALKDEESKVLKHEAIAMDGIAVIINKDNGTDNIAMDMVTKVFTGDVTDWSEVK